MNWIECVRQNKDGSYDQKAKITFCLCFLLDVNLELMCPHKIDVVLTVDVALKKCVALRMMATLSIIFIYHTQSEWICCFFIVQVAVFFSFYCHIPDVIAEKW